MTNEMSRGENKTKQKTTRKFHKNSEEAQPDTLKQRVNTPSKPEMQHHLQHCGLMHPRQLACTVPTWKRLHKFHLIAFLKIMLQGRPLRRSLQVLKAD